MFCSTIIPTIGRSTLTRAVRSVLEQQFSADDFEVIVVNDSGQALPDYDWQCDERIRLVNTNRRERSIARNTGAAVSRGKYLHFLDDDDWLVPNALRSFWELTVQNPDSAWLYGSSQLVDRADKLLIQLRHGLAGNCFVQVMAGEWIPLQASFIDSAAFFAVGGFNPFISGPEDIDLCRRIALQGNLASMDTTVACIEMGLQGSSTDYVRLPHLSRWAREQVLSQPGVFSRLQASANASQWHGRLARIFFTSTLYNLQRRNFMMAALRLGHGLAGCLLAGKNLWSERFWQALTTNYESETFIRGFEEVNQRVERRSVYIRQFAK